MTTIITINETFIVNNTVLEVIEIINESKGFIKLNERYGDYNNRGEFEKRDRIIWINIQNIVRFHEQ